MKFIQSQVFQVQSSDPTQLGDYTVRITGVVSEGPQKGTSASFSFMVHILPFDNAVQVNNAPYFLQDLPPIVTTTASKENFDLGLTLPQTFDPDNDQVAISFNFG
jgi:hypothetical protein